MPVSERVGEPKSGTGSKDGGKAGKEKAAATAREQSGLTLRECKEALVSIHDSVTGHGKIARIAEGEGMKTTGEKDSFRHTYASAVVADCLGNGTAKTLGDMNEVAGFTRFVAQRVAKAASDVLKGNPFDKDGHTAAWESYSAETLADFQNNALGRSMAEKQGSLAEIREAVRDAVLSGKTVEGMKDGSLRPTGPGDGFDNKRRIP